MVTLEQHGFLNIIYLVCFYQSSQAYFNRCPEMVELELYSKRKCTNQKEYHCLEEDGIELKNREECRTPEWVSIGNYPLFRGIYIDYEMCPVDSYQPSLFRSNENNKCVYLKSICSSEGQVEVNKGNKSSDVACRCDSNRGFAFVIRPKNQRACISSQEDCSCYSKPCAGGKKLNPDYECKTITELHGNSTYYVITVTGKENTSNNASFVVTNLNNVVSGKEGHIYGLIGLKSLILFVVLLLSAFSIGSFNYQLDHSPKNNPPNQVVYKDPIQQEMNQKTAFNYQLDHSPKNNPPNQVVYKDPIKQEMNQKTALGIVYETTASTKDNEHQYRDRKIYEIDNKRNEEINLMKTETDLSTPTEKADIVILHTKDENQKQEVADFKSLLERISSSGIRYHLFEELFPKEQYNSGIEIQTVLRKCNFIFVYISKDYVSSKLKRFGLKESSINDALEATETKTKIKKLSNCERWIMPADKQLSPPDFEFHNFDYRSKDSISKYQKFLGDILSNVF